MDGHEHDMAPDDVSGIDVNEIQKNILELVNQKAILRKELYECMRTRDGRKLVELLVENAADDVELVMKLRYIGMADPDPSLDDAEKEALKLLMFTHLGLRG